MKIGINARTFSVDEPGGAVQTAIKISQKIASRPDVDVVLFGHKSVSELFPQCQLVSTGYPKKSQAYGLFWERFILPQLAAEQGVDALLCPNGNAPPFEISIPVVMYIHDVNALKRMSNSYHYFYRKTTVPLAAKAANTVITVSEFSKGEISECIGIPEHKIFVAHNGIKEYFLSDDPGDSVSLPAEYILFVGSLNPRKNIERLIEAYRDLRENTEYTHELVIIGPDNKKIFKNLDISGEDIVTPGFLSLEELKYSYRMSDVFVFPSLYEGFGLPAVEAMACGTPVVASNVSAIPEILGDAPCYVDPYDVCSIREGIQQTLEKDTTEVVKMGRRIASKYTWDQTVERVIEVCKIAASR